MKINVSLLIILLLISIIFLPIGSGELSKIKLNPSNPELSLMRGQTKNGHFVLSNFGNETISGILMTDQYSCAHHCPSIEIISSKLIYIHPNGSTKVEYKIKSYWRNDVQKLPFQIRLITDDKEFKIEIIVNIKHNFQMYSICAIIPIIFLIGLAFIIHRIRRRSEKKDS